MPLVLNTDQGSVFNSAAYEGLLTSSRVRQSMDGKARWVDNVISGEVVPQPQDRVREDRRARDACGARGLVAAYVEQCNNARPHQSLGYDAPAEWYYSGLMAA